MEIVIYVYQGMTMLDAIGPYEVLRNIKDCEIKFVAKKKGEIVADSQFIGVNVKHEIDDIKRADILLVPGATIGFLREIKDKKVLNWIKEMDKRTTKTISVCSGSIILAAAGLLENRKATSHWKVVDFLSEYGATPTRERFVVDGKYITAAGVSAGIDMAIHLINELKGEKVAKATQLVIEYDPKPMFNSGNYLKAEPEIINLAEKIMTSEAKKELSFWDLISNAKSLFLLGKKNRLRDD